MDPSSKKLRRRSIRNLRRSSFSYHPPNVSFQEPDLDIQNDADAPPAGGYGSAWLGLEDENIDPQEHCSFSVLGSAEKVKCGKPLAPLSDNDQLGTPEILQGVVSPATTMSLSPLSHTDQLGTPVSLHSVMSPTMTMSLPPLDLNQYGSLGPWLENNPLACSSTETCDKSDIAPKDFSHFQFNDVTQSMSDPTLPQSKDRTEFDTLRNTRFSLSPHLLNQSKKEGEDIFNEGFVDDVLNERTLTPSSLLCIVSDSSPALDMLEASRSLTGKQSKTQMNLDASPELLDLNIQIITPKSSAASGGAMQSLSRRFEGLSTESDPQNEPMSQSFASMQLSNEHQDKPHFGNKPASQTDTSCLNVLSEIDINLHQFHPFGTPTDTDPASNSNPNDVVCLSTGLTKNVEYSSQSLWHDSNELGNKSRRSRGRLSLKKCEGSKEDEVKEKDTNVECAAPVIQTSSEAVDIQDKSTIKVSQSVTNSSGEHTGQPSSIFMCANQEDSTSKVLNEINADVDPLGYGKSNLSDQQAIGGSVSDTTSLSSEGIDRVDFNEAAALLTRNLNTLFEDIDASLKHGQTKQSISKKKRRSSRMFTPMETLSACGNTNVVDLSQEQNITKVNPTDEDVSEIVHGDICRDYLTVSVSGNFNSHNNAERFLTTDVEDKGQGLDQQRMSQYPPSQVMDEFVNLEDVQLDLVGVSNLSSSESAGTQIEKKKRVRPKKVDSMSGGLSKDVGITNNANDLCLEETSSSTNIAGVDNTIVSRSRRRSGRFLKDITIVSEDQIELCPDKSVQVSDGNSRLATMEISESVFPALQSPSSFVNSSDIYDSILSSEHGEDDNLLTSSPLSSGVRRRNAPRISKRKSWGQPLVPPNLEKGPLTNVSKGKRKSKKNQTSVNNGDSCHTSQLEHECAQDCDFNDSDDSFQVTPELELLYRNKNYKLPETPCYWPTITEHPKKHVFSRDSYLRIVRFDVKPPKERILKQKKLMAALKKTTNTKRVKVSHDQFKEKLASIDTMLAE